MCYLRNFQGVAFHVRSPPPYPPPRWQRDRRHLFFTELSFYWKQVLREKRIPPWMEVALIPMTGKPSLYPGLYLFTTPCRLVRPVQNLELGKEELIGTMEQVHRPLWWYNIQLSETQLTVKVLQLSWQSGIWKKVTTYFLPPLWSAWSSFHAYQTWEGWCSP